MIWAIICLGLVYQAAAQTCVLGSSGADGQDLEIAILADYSKGCYYEYLNGVPQPPLCNTTNGRPGTSTTISVLTGLNAGCALLGTSEVCNGTQGPQGLQGMQGAQGQQGANTWPVISVIPGTGCLRITANGTAAVKCNVTTGIQGLQGVQGLQGIQGIPGVNGAQGITGAAGSVLPRYQVIDGISGGYPYNAAGIAEALCQVGCGSIDCHTCGATSTGAGGVVYIGANCGTGTCSTGPQTIFLTNQLFIPSNTVLDLGGNTLQMPYAGCAAGTMILAKFWSIALSGIQTVVTNLVPVANSTIGSTTLFLAPLSESTAPILPGDYCVINNIYVDGTPSANYGSSSQIVRVVAFSNATGVLNISEPLIGAWGLPFNPTYQGALTCYDPNTFIVNAGIQNGVLSMASTCANVLLSVNGASRFVMRNIRFVGNYTGGQSAFSMTNSLDVDIYDVRIQGTSNANVPVNMVTTSGVNLDSVLNSNDGSTSTTPTYGMWMQSSNFMVADNIHVEGMSSTGFYFRQSLFNVASNVHVTSSPAAQGAVQFGYGSRYNIMFNTVITGCTGPSVGYDGNIGVRYNQMWNTLAKNPAGSGVNFQTSAGIQTRGNFLDGSFDANHLGDQGGVQPAFDNLIRQSSGSNGFPVFTVQNGTLTAADFPARRMFGWSTASDTLLTTSLIGIDGTVRSGSFAVA